MGCGFCESALSNSVGTLVVDCVVKPVGRQFDYVCRFHDNVEELIERKFALERARARLQREIEDAQRQILQVEDDVRHSQSKADATLFDVETLQKEIQQNKSYLNWCPNWIWRYQLSKKAKKKTIDISQLLETISKFGQPGRVGYPATSTLSTIEFLCSKDFVVSKSSEIAFNQIIQALKNENISMIGLWGMGGVGKTTLVCEVGKQVEAQNPKLFDKVVITTVSQKPNFEAIQDQIAKDIGFDMKTGIGRKSERELWLRLKKEERVLIILDDVWTYINLKEKLGIPVGEDHKGCKILLTTRLQQVCVSMDCQEVVPLGCLDGEEAWTLFAIKAGLKDSSDDAIQNLAKQIIKKCQGLPTAIVTLGSALKGKSYHGWEAAYRRLKYRRLTEIEDVNEENAYLCLEASFDYLKNIETKICFLLCSLFPEDYKIYVEDLVRFSWGLELYKDTNSISEVRNEVLAQIEILKNSCLLLDCGQRHIKMHDLVREVALWIASSRNEISFAVKSEVVGTLLKDESLKNYTAMSFKTYQTTELPNGLVFPNLKIVLLGDYRGVEISGEFLQGMEALQVCVVDHGLISPATFQFQLNLRTLNLYNCEFSDISMLGRLKALEILSLNRSRIVELPNEIGDLENLRLLEMLYCRNLQRIPPNLLGRLSNLEEVYLHGCRSIKWVTENSPTEEKSNSSLSELNSLPKLGVLSLDISSHHLPNGFVFRKLESFDVCIGIQKGGGYRKREFETCPISRTLIIDKSADACRQLFEGVESLELKHVVGHLNLVPSLAFGHVGFHRLISLSLEGCQSMKCLVDASLQLVPTTALSNLVDLSLREMVGLEELCNGPQPRGFLHKLKILITFDCREMTGGIPILQNLEELKVKCCDKMQVLFQIGEKGPTHHFSLQSLKVVEIKGCDSFKHLFPVCVANSLGQLQSLVITRCGQLEEIIQQPQATDICLQSLREVSVSHCNKLRSLSSLSHGRRMKNLTTLSISCCPQLEYTFPVSMAEGLPLLNEVDLFDLPKFNGRGGDDIVLTLPSLHALRLEYCPQLTHFIISAQIQPQESVLSGKDKMKQTFSMTVPKLRGESSGRMEYSSISNSGYNNSSLKSLFLSDLTELREIWNGLIHIANFRNLTELSVTYCGKLRYIFSATMAQNLPQLSALHISFCVELEKIIGKDQTSSQDLLQANCFPNLAQIDIWKCENLKCVFPVTIAHGGLLKLKELRLEDVSKLEVVFEGDEANVQEKVIRLPQFTNLKLTELPNCASLSPVGYHFVFPSLEEIHVISCPNITTKLWC